jgi:O-antigen ligase
MAELKYIIFFFALVVGVPLGIFLTARLPVLEKFVVLLLVLSTVMPDDTSINFYSREFYFALTKGLEISLGDLCALVLLGVILLKRKEYAAPGLPPMALCFLGLLLAGFLSWLLAPSSVPVPAAAQEHPFFLPYDIFETKLYPLFETSKWFRGFVLFLALYYYMRKPENLDTVVMAMCIGTIYMGYIVLTDRYLHGVHRVKGTLQHPNSLATYMAMCGTFLFCILLAEKRWWRIGLLCLALGLAGISVIMTISRGGLAALVLGLGLGFLLLGWRNISVKNLVIVTLGAIAGVVVLAAAADTLMTRFLGEQDAADDMEYRMYYNNQAKLMAADKFFGVGLGNWSAFSWDRYAAMVDPDNPPGTPAHNIWFLTLGETGYFGLLLFFLFWARFFSLAVPLILWRLRGMELAAATGAMLLCFVCHIQSMVQLSFRQTPIFFLMMMAIAIVAALGKNWRLQQKHNGLPAPPMTKQATRPPTALSAQGRA